ncbi:hypothetical protein CLAFUW4_03264 [Fulvia fulva]|uniref:Uncharacterized protein n=1 Tax=Passalora fulva TaxID=5499 RepID=A0A9Q8LAW8_PASFU|nr:uncharacterized protein CLAFUR5_03246 [Fulvia fulva]KAK4632264.1 hypothetical protein CLAFUR4_03253 [Fulvia fulva]KAK4633382.1 hypothetical protein CLAFUR0_03257 [Fulvia fulva]UJO14044.1 hypothetical protein CLAFUR5_03246 [Fulvia fulva]WPV11149.1 hypothetical protein CLAFUW4_03264 [Fulvia fulva]WPV26368.1 hypothetical protein CLAFUW7_03257 [Fulvia fulva]
MHFPSTFSCLLAALSSASHVLADAIHDTQPTPTIDAAAHMVTPNDALQDYLENGNNIDNHLELRQATDYNLAATTAPTQAGAVTTLYMNQQVGTTVTYAAIVYTQLFSKVPDQLPLPGVGSIGLGNLVKQEKREAAPTPAPGIAGRIAT